MPNLFPHKCIGVTENKLHAVQLICRVKQAREREGSFQFFQASRCTECAALNLSIKTFSDSLHQFQYKPGKKETSSMSFSSIAVVVTSVLLKRCPDAAAVDAGVGENLTDTVKSGV